jgi:FtsP/CotA-like multicopper oxidase with cupredoxin domain
MLKEKGGPLAVVTVGEPAPSVAAIPARLRSIQPLAAPEAAPSRTIELSGERSWVRSVDWYINHEAHHHADPVRVGELQVWDVVNASKMDHPFHLHGFFFQVLSVNGEPRPFVSWEDTVNVPAQSTVRIAWMPDDRPGSWMYHCHILEHHAAGMMAHFDVVR